MNRKKIENVEKPKTIEPYVSIRIPRKYFENISADAEKCLRTDEKQLEFVLREYYVEDPQEDDKFATFLKLLSRTEE